ncbi:MAG: ABC transporter permease [Bryobacter sp.]|jgi:lipopolysaccharide transport system permease protein|nr:ABC transporter permease [Bryobacter sp. CoA8 C33]
MSGLPGFGFLRNLIERRSLLFQMVRRDFERRYVGSIGGWLWGLAQPLVLLLSWTFVFHICLKMGVPPGQGTSNYTLFLFTGYLPWMLFSETLTRSSTSLLENSNLITKTVFPSEMIPVSVFFSSLVNHGLTFAIALIAVIFFDGGISYFVWLLPVYILLLGLLSIGLSWMIAAFQVYLRDTAQVVTVVLSLWFWVTPIFIDIEQIPERFRWLPALNPLSFLVKAYRERILTHRLPDWSELAFLAASSGLAFLLGGLVFKQLKKGFADVL